MASVLVDGLVVPISIGGHPAIDFCNTVAFWRTPAQKEYLASHAHLAVWARENGLLSVPAVARLRRQARRAPAEASAVVARAIRFRQGLHAILTSDARPADWTAVNQEVHRAGQAVVLRPGRPAATWELPVATGLDLPLLAVAWAAAELLTTSTATVSVCPGDTGDNCGWLFSNPNGRRRWCSMAICGNRAKARRHAERHREDRLEQSRP
jgi:predicted RNA-binding Zn ribbon-like protein